MNKDSLEKKYTDLGLSLWSDTIIYIPKKIFIKNKISEIDFSKYLNEFLLINLKNGFSFDAIGNDNTKFISKGTILDRNIFKLLSQKSELKTHEFDYILEKYCTVVEYHFFITDWLVKNLDKHMSDKIDDTVSHFLHLQLSLSKNHFEEFIKHFYPSKDLIPKGIFNVTEMIKEHFPNLLVKYRLTDAVNSSESKENGVVKDSESSKPISSKKVKKKPLITPEEADAFLLESVFNVKFKK